MTVGSGIGATLGTGIESSYGTPTAPTRWLEFESAQLKSDIKRTTGKGIYGGIGMPRGTNRLTTTVTTGGTVKTPLYFKGMGHWLGLTMGTLNTTPAQQSATAAYLQTHAWNPDNVGQSLSIQQGIPDLTGAIRPYTAIGAKVTQAQFDISVDEFAEATFTIDAKDLIEATVVRPGASTLAYTTPAYQVNNPPFAWGTEGTFKLGTFGSETTVSGVRKMTLTIKRSMATDRFYIDGTATKSEPVTNGFVEVSGTIDTDFIDKTKFADVYANNGFNSMVLTFTGPTAIASTFFPSISFTIPQVYFGGESPTIGGPDIIQPSIPFMAQYDDTHNPFTISYMSTDTAL